MPDNHDTCDFEPWECPACGMPGKPPCSRCADRPGYDPDAVRDFEDVPAIVEVATSLLLAADAALSTLEWLDGFLRERGMVIVDERCSRSLLESAIAKARRFQSSGGL